MENNFLITKTTKNKPNGLFLVEKSLPFNRVKNAVLGKNYELSLVFIGKKYSQTLNKKYRCKDKSTDILSFPLSKTSGEIFITPEVAKRVAKKFDMKENDFITHLFIHGLLHLKGLKHGDKMEKEEERLKKKYI